MYGFQGTEDGAPDDPENATLTSGYVSHRLRRFLGFGPSI